MKPKILIGILALMLIAPQIPHVQGAEGDYTGDHWDTAGSSTDLFGLTTNGINIWTVSHGGKRVYRWDMNGNIQDSWGTGGQSGDPMRITTDGTNIWVMDFLDKRVYRYTMIGGYLDSWSTAGEGTGLRGIATDGSNIWIADQSSDEVYKYTMAGVYTTEHWDTGDADDPKGMTTDGINIWIVDSVDKEVYKYDMAGLFIDSFDTSGEINEAYGIGIDTLNNFIWVGDVTNEEVFKYAGPTPPPPPPDPIFPPTESIETPAYLPALRDHELYEDYNSSTFGTFSYENINMKANMRGFYSNYTNMFHYWGFMGRHFIRHASTRHDSIGYAYSPDGVNWNSNPYWGMSSYNDLSDFRPGEGKFDVVLDANGRDFWIVAYNDYHGNPWDVLGRKGYLLKNGSVRWYAQKQIIHSGPIDGIKLPTTPLDAETDSTGRLFVSISVTWSGDFGTVISHTNNTDGTYVQVGLYPYDSTLDWNKGDGEREYVKLNRLADGKMAATGIFDDPGAGMFYAYTGWFDGANWAYQDSNRLFESVLANTLMWKKVDIVSYGDRLIATYVKRESGNRQALSVSDGYYQSAWGNRTELVTDYDEFGVVPIPHLTVTDEGNAVLWVYLDGNYYLNYTYRFSNYTWNLPFVNFIMNVSGADYEWNRFSFVDSTENFMPFWFQDGTEIFTELGFHYFSWNGSLLPLVFEHLNTTLYNPGAMTGGIGGNVNDGWMFEGEVYTLESYIFGGEEFNINTGDSFHDISFHWNNETEQMWINVDPGDPFTIGLVYSEFERFGNITRLLWRFIPDRSIIDSLNNTWWRTLTTGGFSTFEFLGFNTSIYNLGGLTTYIFTGDGTRTVGGHPFELQATNGSDGSTARAEQIYRKLQQLHFLIEIDMDNEWGSGAGEFDIDPGVGWIDIGIDYRLNATWVEGFYVRLYVQNADVGHHNAGNDQNWVEWSVDWYNYDPGSGTTQNIRSGLIYSNHWGYDNENLSPDYHNRTSSQLWVDLWFDRTNASTTISGQVNAMYNGMREHGSSWWFGYGDFQPMISDYGNAMFLDDLYDETGNVTNSIAFDLMRVFVEVGKVDIEDGNDETWTIRAIENFNRKHADDRMQGIEQPAFEQTLVLDMPMFQSNNPLIRAIDGISRTIWMGALGFIKILWGAMDTIFEWAGFGAGFFSILSRFVIETIPDLIIVIMQNLSVLVISFVDIIESIFNLLVVVVPTYVIGLGWLAEALIDYWRAFSDIFAGGIVDFSIIEDLALGTWISAGITMLPFYEIWTIIWSKDVSGKLKERFEFYSALFGGLLSFFMIIVSLVSELVQAIRSFLPI